MGKEVVYATDETGDADISITDPVVQSAKIKRKGKSTQNEAVYSTDEGSSPSETSSNIWGVQEVGGIREKNAKTRGVIWHSAALGWGILSLTSAALVSVGITMPSLATSPEYPEGGYGLGFFEDCVSIPGKSVECDSNDATGLEWWYAALPLLIIGVVLIFFIVVLILASICGHYNCIPRAKKMAVLANSLMFLGWLFVPLAIWTLPEGDCTYRICELEKNSKPGFIKWTPGTAAYLIFAGCSLFGVSTVLSVPLSISQTLEVRFEGSATDQEC